MSDGRFKPGQSGNPAGKAPGTKNKKTLLAEELEQAASGVQAVVIAKALEGDIQAAGLVLTRVHPPLRSRAERVQFDLNPDMPLAAQAQQVLVAVAEGEIDPETGQLIVNLISSFAGIKATDEFAARLEALEKRK
jgi:hypothetical protein